MIQDSFLEQWEAVTQPLGVYGECVFLSAIAAKGYEKLGRGAVAIDLTQPEVLICYADLEQWAKGFDGNGREASLKELEQYDPDVEFVVVAIEGIADPYFYVTTFLMERCTTGSPAGEQLAAKVYTQGLSSKKIEIPAHPDLDDRN